MPSFQDRAAGALMGAFIGDALGLGPHWYYDLDEMRADYGEWISDYTDPKPGRYHAGLKAGQLSQAGIILELTVRSLVEQGRYDEADFCRRMDEDLFPKLDGKPMSGPGGYTSQSIREAWKRRVEEKLPWGQTAGQADNTEAIERVLAIAIRYAKDPRSLALHVGNNTALMQADEFVQSATVAFCAALGLLVQGDRLDIAISAKLMAMAKSGELPFFGRFASPDSLLLPSSIAKAAADPAVTIEPAWKVSSVYGMHCAVNQVMPAAYYLAARFPGDFESAVLHAINGGGQNQARAILTGALAGAQVGIGGIPQRFVDGLERGTELMALAKRLAEQGDL